MLAILQGPSCLDDVKQCQMPPARARVVVTGGYYCIWVLPARWGDPAGIRICVVQRADGEQTDLHVDDRVPWSAMCVGGGRAWSVLRPGSGEEERECVVHVLFEASESERMVEDWRR